MGKIVKSGPKRPNPEGRRVQRDRLSGRFAHVSKTLVFNPVTKTFVKTRAPGATYRYRYRGERKRREPEVSVSKRKPAPGFLSRRARGQGYSNALAECASQWKRRGA